MSNKVCFLCNQLFDDPRQCIQCSKMFCYKCITNYYQNERKCPNCSFYQRLDEYCPVIGSEINEYDSSLYTENNKRHFCVECLEKFSDREIKYHINHHSYSYNIIEQVNIMDILENINKIICFKNDIQTNYNECRNEIELLNSIKKIKLEEIDNIKVIIESFYQKKYESLKGNESDLGTLLSNYNKNINKSFLKIKDIIDNLNTNNLNNLLNEGNIKIKKYLNNIENDKKKLENLIKNDRLKYSFTFKSHVGQKIESNQFKWNRYSINNTINLSLASNPQCKIYIYQTEKDRMNLRVDFNEKDKSNYKYYFLNLGIFNRKKNKALEIPIKYYIYNKNDKIMTFESNFENIKEFGELIGDGLEIKFYISELELENLEN